uniref:Uncharacterized protein n=1 Tax=Ciona intestinalis TaxID=7719 RepID=H2XUZ0_CIOIN
MSSTDDDDATSVKERFGAVNTSHYDIVKFLCRPWHHIDGQINYDTAKTFVAGVFLHILRNPGVNLRGLSKQFGHAMQRVVLEEVTQSLVDCKCVSRHSNDHVTGTWRIFDSDVISKNKKDDYYITTNDGLLRLSYIIK